LSITSRGGGSQRLFGERQKERDRTDRYQIRCIYIYVYRQRVKLDSDRYVV
jgi:hypothetical protein